MTTNPLAIPQESDSSSVRLGAQNFDFSSPKSELEKARTTPPSGFNRVILDKPVNPDEYIVGVGDNFLLNISGKIKSAMILTVGPEGKIMLPDIGDVEVAGLTLAQTKAKATALAKKRFPNLDFELLLSEPRSFKIYVLGEVNNPGVYVANATNRAADAIVLAGGIKNIGSLRKIQIRRGGKVLYADLYIYGLNGDLSANPNLLDGDIVFVPLSLPRVTIGGGIKRAGIYELESGEDIRHLINRIGGLSSNVSYEKPLKIVRMFNQKKKDTIFLNLKEVLDQKAKPVVLNDGDSIFVPSITEVPFNEINVYVTGEVKKPGPYPFMPGYTAKAYIGVAGGLTTRGKYSQALIVRSDGTKIPLSENTVLEIGDTVHVPEKFIKVWQDCLIITTSISSLTLAVIAAMK